MPFKNCTYERFFKIEKKIEVLLKQRIKPGLEELYNQINTEFANMLSLNTVLTTLNIITVYLEEESMQFNLRHSCNFRNKVPLSGNQTSCCSRRSPSSAASASTTPRCTRARASSWQSRRSPSTVSAITRPQVIRFEEILIDLLIDSFISI